RGDARIDRLELFEVCLYRLFDGGIVRRRCIGVRLPERGCDVRARILDEDSGRARLAARDVPAALERQVGVDRPGAALRVPEAGLELHVQLRVVTRAELRDRRLLQLVEPGLRVIERPQHGEAHA